MDTTTDLTGFLHRGHRTSGSMARVRRNKWRMIRHRLKLCIASVLMHKAQPPADIRPDAGASYSVQEGTSAADGFARTLQSFMQSSDLSVAVYWRSFVTNDAPPLKHRVRDLFPIPPLRVWPSHLNTGGVHMCSCLNVTNMCLSALNCLEKGLKSALPEHVPQKPSAAQRSAQDHVASKVARFLTRLNTVLAPDFCWSGSFNESERLEHSRSEAIRADDVDLPSRAGTCDPLKLISTDLACGISNAAVVFPEQPMGKPFATVAAAQRPEYVRLSVRELQCGKLRLRRRVHAVAGVFASGKSSGRQRKIWDGSDVSQQATPPPRPRRLANPSCFLELEVQKGEAVYFSKRDAATFFDTLRVSRVLQPWFGQPAVTVRELLEAGLSLDVVRASCDDGDGESFAMDTRLYPTSVVWPMGFSWSSAVAQDTTLATCVQAGIHETSILSPDHDPPACQDELVLVATDDTVLFHRDVARGKKTLQSLDAAFRANGIPRNCAKDVTLAPEITALGCDLCSAPPVAEPAAGRLGKAIQRTVDLLHTGVASPRGLHALLGVWEWFALLQRGFFSIYKDSYAFVMQTPEHEPAGLPNSVLTEFLVTLLLSPLLSAGLDRLPLNMLIATDASPDFGFGVVASPCSASVASEVCKLAERRGDFVRLTQSPGDPVELRRLGNPRRLKLRQRDFRTVIRSRPRWSAHSGVLEVHGYLLGLKWAARDPRKHHSKLPCLVDAKAVVGAAAKGRSSARAFLTVLRSAAAYSLAADFLPRIIYIPSESNPADAPSRGMRRRRGATWKATTCRSPSPCSHV